MNAFRSCRLVLPMALAVLAGAACAPGGRGDGGGGGGGGGGSGSGGSGGSGSGTGSGSGGSGSGSDATTYVYAHSSSALYRVDPDTLAITEVGAFGWPIPLLPDQMTDLAIDSTGLMIGVSFTCVYSVDPTTAKTTLLSANLGESFNALSFVPASALGSSGADVLVGARNTDGVVFEIDQSTGATTQIGNMGGSYVSSGDLVAVDGFGMVQTVPGGSSGDQLVRLATSTFAATPIGTGTGFSDIWGLAFWKNQIYGFTNTGQFVLIDPTTGDATLVVNNGVEWWGAAVTTTAPVIE
jgi:hypothetical protein